MENDFSDFIIGTAKDYDMSKHDVKSIYDRTRGSNLFYEQLEQFIKVRAAIYNGKNKE